MGGFPFFSRDYYMELFIGKMFHICYAGHLIKINHFSCFLRHENRAYWRDKETNVGPEVKPPVTHI